MDKNLKSTSNQKPTVSLLKTNILLIDSCLISQKLISKMLGKIGYSVIIAGNCMNADNILNTHDIDMILMDMHARKHNGFDITEIAKEKERQTGKHIPVIALTDNVMKLHREKCFETGLDEYLPKPIFENELCRVIDKLSEKNQVIHPGT